MPLLTYETNARAVTHAGLKQVDVQLQQVLERSARTR